MTNWCENILVVEGERKRLDEFKGKVASEKASVDFDQLVSLPSEFDRRVRDWGWKLNPEWLSENSGDQSITYSFDTPWGPPLEWLRQIAALFPDLMFALRFQEKETELAGVAVFENGRAWKRCQV